MRSLSLDADLSKQSKRVIYMKIESGYISTSPTHLSNLESVFVVSDTFALPSITFLDCQAIVI